MSQNINSQKENRSPQTSFNLPDMTLPDNFFSNFEEITKKYDNTTNNDKNNQQKNKNPFNLNINSLNDEDDEYKKRNRIYTIILIILIVVPPACSITFFPSPLGALATVGWLLFVAFGAIKTWWNVYGPGKILEKHIVSEGVRMGRKRR